MDTDTLYKNEVQFARDFAQREHCTVEIYYNADTRQFASLDANAIDEKPSGKWTLVKTVYPK